MGLNLLDTKISMGSQDYTLTNLYVGVIEKTSHGIKQTRTHKLRVSIKSDSYLQQCWAHCDIYSPEEKKWNRLCTIPAGSMQTVSGLSHYQDAPGEHEFQKDVTELLRLADLILM